MTIVENTNPVSSDTPTVMLLISDVGLPEEVACWKVNIVFLKIKKVHVLS